MKKSLFVLMIALGVMAACSDDKESITITENVNSNVVYADELKGSINFTASDRWTAELDPDNAVNWISLENTSGSAGNATIQYSTIYNITGAERKATIIIECGKKKLGVQVTQKAVTEKGVTPTLQTWLRFIEIESQKQRDKFEIKYEKYDRMSFLDFGNTNQWDFDYTDGIMATNTTADSEETYHLHLYSDRITKVNRYEDGEDKYIKDIIYDKNHISSTSKNDNTISTFTWTDDNLTTIVNSDQEKEFTINIEYYDDQDLPYRADINYVVAKSGFFEQTDVRRYLAMEGRYGTNNKLIKNISEKGTINISGQPVEVITESVYEYSSDIYGYIKECNVEYKISRNGIEETDAVNYLFIYDFTINID